MSPRQALEVACHALEYRSPAYSAHSVLARWQRVILISIAVLFLLGLIFLPWVTGVLLVALAIVSYVWALGFRFLLFKHGARGGRMVKIADEDARAFPDAQLPVYTVLVPAFKEPLIEELVEALECIDYPRPLPRPASCGPGRT